MWNGDWFFWFCCPSITLLYSERASENSTSSELIRLVMDDVFCSCYHPCTAHSLLCRASHLACAPLHYLYMSAHVCAFIIIKICDRLGASCNGRGFIVNSWDEMYVDSQSVGRCVTGAPRSLHAVVDSKHRQKQFSYSSISVDCFHTRTGRQSVRERQREREV